MKSNELRLQLLDHYKRNGIDVASMPNGKGWRDRQDCHWPKPECLGGTETIPLLKDGHVLMDLLVSEEVGHRCFYNRDAKFLVSHLPQELDAEVAAMFVALYQKWVTAPRSEEEKQKISRKLKGQPRPQSTKDKIGDANRRRVWKESSKKKTSETLKGNPKLKECGKKLGALVWISLITGLISSAGNVAQHNRRQGGDGAARLKLSEEDAAYLLSIPQDQRLGWLGLQKGDPGWRHVTAQSASIASVSSSS